MELKHTENPIETASLDQEVLSNLFYGWGYNFYRKENQLRADDLMVRSKVSEMLGAARAHVADLESTWRREKLPAPSRGHPFPDAHATATADALERTQRAIEALEVRVRNAAVPEMDRVNQRHRRERSDLQQLTAIDLALVGAVRAACETVGKLVDPETAARAAEAALRAGRIDSALAARERVLSIVALD
ncbi:MAG: hypothetical protein ACREPL_07095 [Rhodanobacteraceae bacterium]